MANVYNQTDSVHSCGDIYSGLTVACTGKAPINGFTSLIARKNGVFGVANHTINFRALGVGIGIAWQIPFGFCDPYQKPGGNTSYIIKLNVVSPPAWAGLLWKSTYICEVNPLTCTSIGTPTSLINHDIAISNIGPAIYTVRVNSVAGYIFGNNGQAYICLYFSNSSGNVQAIDIRSDQVITIQSMLGTDCLGGRFPYRPLIDEQGVVCY